MSKTKSSLPESLKTGIDVTKGLDFNRPINTSYLDNGEKQEERKTVEPKKEYKSKESKKKQSKSSKLEKMPLDDGERYHLSIYITNKAKKNLEKYSKEYGYRKMSPFVCDLLENLDAYLD